MSRTENGEKTYDYILIVIIRIGVCAHSLNESKNVNSSIINVWKRNEMKRRCHQPACPLLTSINRMKLWHSKLADPNQSKCIARCIVDIYGPGEINFFFILTRQNFPEFIHHTSRIAVRVTSCNKTHRIDSKFGCAYKMRTISSKSSSFGFWADKNLK